ncbi:MAG: recombinase family protein [Chloroflexi bacterium]|nr:recombinase family protein [Chloroflexota bacterium]
MRAVGYFKPLTADVVEPISRRDDPLSAIKQYCLEELHQLIATIPGDEVGAPVTPESTDSERLQSLIQFFEQSEHRHALVVIPNSTHLAADLESLVKALIDIEASGGDVRCANFDAPDAVQDGLEKLALSGRRPGRQRRIQEAILAKASRGEVLGRVPYGYRGGPDGMMHPVLEEAEVVAQVFDWYLGNPSSHDELGTGVNGIGLRKIASELNARGLQTRAGKPWSPVAIAGMLRNRTYIGTYARHGMRIVTNHQPIIERPRFNRAQEILESRRPIRKRRTKASFPLGGLLECATCGNGINGVTRSRSWMLSDGSSRSREYKYYACRLFSRSHDDDNKHASWDAAKLEQLVLDRLNALDGRTLQKKLAQDSDSGSSGVAEVESRFMRQYRAVADGQAPLRSLVANVQELENARSGGEIASVATGVRITVREAISALGNDDNDLKETLSRVLNRVVVGPSEIELVLKI